jgi:beta-glucosidase
MSQLTLVTACLAAASCLAAAAAVPAAPAASAAPAARPWMAKADPPEARAAALLAKMSLDQKVVLLHGGSNGAYTGSTDAIPELGVPGLTLNDGRQGFRPNSGSKTNTAFPAAIQVVSTWDPARMRAFGVAMSEEFLCKGSNVMLAPMLILARVPLDGRIFESTGADPELAYRFAFEMISGVQSIPGVIANADDFVLNNQESDRGGISAVCDERTLFELYYRGYAGAVAANVGSFMCSCTSPAPRRQRAPFFFAAPDPPPPPARIFRHRRQPREWHARLRERRDAGRPQEPARPQLQRLGAVRLGRRALDRGIGAQRP